MVALGKLYFSTGAYAKSADAIQKGLAKGGVSDADDANTLLGIALARSGDKAGAQAAFSAVTPTGPRGEIAQLWTAWLTAPAAA